MEDKIRVYCSLFVVCCLFSNFLFANEDLDESVPNRILEEIDSGSGESAFRAYDGVFLTRTLGKQNEEEKRLLRRRLVTRLLKNPEVRPYIEKSFAETPRNYSRIGELTRLYRPLASIREGWVIRVLARALMDETPLTEPGLNQAEITEMLIRGKFQSSNQPVAAARALSAMRIRASPTDTDIQETLDLVRIDLDEWRLWWLENGREILSEFDEEELFETTLPNSLVQPSRSKNIEGGALRSVEGLESWASRKKRSESGQKKLPWVWIGSATFLVLFSLIHAIFVGKKKA